MSDRSSPPTLTRSMGRQTSTREPEPEETSVRDRQTSTKEPEPEETSSTGRRTRTRATRTRTADESTETESSTISSESSSETPTPTSETSTSETSSITSTTLRTTITSTPLITTTSTQASITATAIPAQGAPAKKVPIPTIAGSIGGGVALLAILGLLFYFIRHTRNSRKARQEELLVRMAKSSSSSPQTSQDGPINFPGQQAYAPVNSTHQPTTSPSQARFSWNSPPSDVTDEFVSYYNAENPYDAPQAQTNTVSAYGAPPGTPYNQHAQPNTTSFPPRADSYHHATTPNPYDGMDLPELKQTSYAEYATPGPGPGRGPSAEPPTTYQPARAYEAYRSPVQHGSPQANLEARRPNSWEYQGSGERDPMWPMR